MLYERITDIPSFVCEDYASQHPEPIIEDSQNDWTEREYYGSGISVENHPLKSHINFNGCGECESENVKVIYSRWCVSTASGDAYWDYEIICENCGKFTARSFNEND
jgi:hypothetical protein